MRNLTCFFTNQRSVALFYTGLAFSLLRIDASAQENGLKVHEWGTFTTLQCSDGYRLSGLHRDEEKLPPFVSRISYTFSDNKGYPQQTFIQGVTVKMETPVLYFYSPQQMQVAVDVKFRGGSISEWFPERSEGESSDFQYLIDFKKPKTGWINWQTTVLAPEDSLNYTPQPVTGNFPQWVAPRYTKSNLVKNPQGQVEKFLFYRGIANFEVPVKVEFNTSGNLVITNQGLDKLSYVLVYDKRDSLPAEIWWAGEIKENYMKVVPRLSASGHIDLEAEMLRFENSLVQAGLYRDEAKAMLNTWKKSYFEHEGLRVFWIASRAFTDDVLPLVLNPRPEELERVIVGRSEILSPEFEEELKKMTVKEMEIRYRDDRFLSAYFESHGRTTLPLTTINKDTDLSVTGITNEKRDGGLYLYPNPATNSIHVGFPCQVSDAVQMVLLNYTGTQVALIADKASKTLYTKDIPLEHLSSGIYLLHIHVGNKQVYTRKIVKE